MNRLRKKSDAANNQKPVLEGLSPLDALPQLTTTNDFRTSLILPDLSRRFSVLRSSTSDPATFDNHLRSRIADQRARGAANQITEEEEDMFLNALGIRLRHNKPDKSQNVKGTSAAANGGYNGRGSEEIGTPRSSTNSSVTSSSNARSAKRYSNNLFGSGRLRDNTYTRSVAPSKSSGSSSRTVSLTPTEASAKKMSISSLPPVNPERLNILPISPEASPTSYADTHADEYESTCSPSVVVPASYDTNHLETLSGVEYLLQNQLGFSNFKRASIALEQAMKEIEDELEEEILLPRTPIPRSNLDQLMPDVRNSQASSFFEGGMAITNDKTVYGDSQHGASPIPARTMPGYVPGMPRPMTPRDLDEQRSHSTTPRAQSPPVVDSVPPLNLSNNSNKVRRDSTSSITKPLAAAPLFLQRSTNGRFTPTPVSTADDSNGDVTESDSPLNSSTFGRQRPASPLAGPPYQPMTLSGRPNSRPSTPSNVIWTPSYPRRPSLNRNNSMTNDGGLSNLDYYGILGSINKPAPLALRSPPVSDSVAEESPRSSPSSNVKSTKEQSATQALKDIVETPSFVQHPVRSVTPTRASQRSPVSPAFSHIRQNGPSSPFNISAFPGLGFSGRANSSRSSINSVGSSFRSWDESDNVFSLFTDPKDQQAAWHDFVDLDQSSLATSDDDESDAENVLKRYGALKRSDIAAVQERLVSASFMKIANTDPRDRAPSALRRRRPSTSQSNYTRIASPPPQIQPPASPTHVVTDDKYSKASALLNSVVESIQDKPSSFDAGITTSDEKDVSPSTRRNRALARVLFGEEDAKDEESESSKDERVKPIPEHIATTSSTSEIPPIFPSDPQTSTSSTASISPEEKSTTYQTESSLQRSASSATAIAPQTPRDQADLVREVQKKAEAAMLALNKTTSSVNLPDGLSHSGSIRRRVDPKDISTPRLVSTTTNLEALPLTNLSNNGSTSKLGSRFRKLRGSLRVKNVVSSGEETVTPASINTTPPSRVAPLESVKPNQWSSSPSGPSGGSPDSSRFKAAIQNPPASAGPGLKGFMARFRNRQRASGPPSSGGMAVILTPTTVPTTPVSPLSARNFDTVTPRTPLPIERSASLSSRLTGQSRPMYSRFPPANPSAAQSSSTSLHAQVQPTSEVVEPTEPSVNLHSQSALQQLLRAANDLGLDQNAVHEILSRSGSISSSNLPSKHITVAAAVPKPVATPDNVQHTASTGSDQTATLTNSVNPPNQKQPEIEVRPVTPEESLRKSSRKPDHIRRPKEGQVNNLVVRRTLVFANDATDLAVQQKNSTRRKRASVASISNRSVHDRVPTPPPPKSSSAKRFSADRMPPMPHLPNFVGQGGQTQNLPLSTTSGQTQSKYDSLYDMYGGDSNTAVGEDGHLLPEPQPALEVIELANGETIWNIVNGLRDGDDTSVYTRSSFVSEYSAQGGNESPNVFTKGHNRSESKGSVSSFASPNKKGQQGKIRPDTKVFYSTSEQIGRLIENLSQGADAGSFNFLPNFSSTRPSHSKSSSLSTNDINWTVEERLERMLGALNGS